MKPKSSRRIDIAITDTVVELGLVRLFADICRNSFYLDWSGPDGAQAMTNMHLMAHIMLTATDRSAGLCRQVVDAGLAGDILEHLNDPKVHPDMLSAKGVETVVSRLLGILHNVVQKCDSARNAYRAASAIDISYQSSCRLRTLR
ncbi:hypothetical protein LSAT2_027812 [Lamellibrachia satsuma]|nr:hypothetical protein LSAT2_027812 [Lamellibrachia satsuma]